jgi:hypothetical protein
MLKAAFVGLMILLMPSPALTEPILTITCHEPKGKRMEYGVFLYEYYDAKIKKQTLPKPRLRTMDDGYTGLTIPFIIDSAAPNKMTYVWGETAEVESYRKDARRLGIPVPPPIVREQQADIMVFNEDLISTLEKGPRYMWVNSFFPKLGVAYFAQHEYGEFESAAWNTQISLFARCEFAWWKAGSPGPSVK